MNIVMSAMRFDKNDMQSILIDSHLGLSFCFRMILDYNDSNRQNVCTTEVHNTFKNIVKFQEQTKFLIFPLMAFPREN